MGAVCEYLWEANGLAYIYLHQPIEFCGSYINVNNRRKLWSHQKWIYRCLLTAVISSPFIQEGSNITVNKFIELVRAPRVETFWSVSQEGQNRSHANQGAWFICVKYNIGLQGVQIFWKIFRGRWTRAVPLCTHAEHIRQLLSAAIATLAVK